ncbi:MAG: hypothetical protein AVDCRST_MAG18-1025, partial [uncultured Thermomicrobiales bacterium]
GSGHVRGIAGRVAAALSRRRRPPGPDGRGREMRRPDRGAHPRDRRQRPALGRSDRPQPRRHLALRSGRPPPGRSGDRLVPALSAGQRHCVDAGVAGRRVHHRDLEPGAPRRPPPVRHGRGGDGAARDRGAGLRAHRAGAHHRWRGGPAACPALPQPGWPGGAGGAQGARADRGAASASGRHPLHAASRLVHAQAGGRLQRHAERHHRLRLPERPGARAVPPPRRPAAGAAAGGPGQPGAGGAAPLLRRAGAGAGLRRARPGESRPGRAGGWRGAAAGRALRQLRGDRPHLHPLLPGRGRARGPPARDGERLPRGAARAPPRRRGGLRRPGGARRWRLGGRAGEQQVARGVRRAAPDRPAQPHAGADRPDAPAGGAAHSPPRAHRGATAL